jgi:hypothetical protein
LMADLVSVVLRRYQAGSRHERLECELGQPGSERAGVKGHNWSRVVEVVELLLGLLRRLTCRRRRTLMMKLRSTLLDPVRPRQRGVLAPRTKAPSLRIPLAPFSISLSSANGRFRLCVFPRTVIPLDASSCPCPFVNNCYRSPHSTLSLFETTRLLPLTHRSPTWLRL